MFDVPIHTEYNILFLNGGSTHLMVFLTLLIGGFRQGDQPHGIKRKYSFSEAKNDC